MRWLRRDRPTRAALIERKHELEGEIRQVAAEIRHRNARNEPTGEAEAHLAHLRDVHYNTRLEIDRANPGA